MNSVKLSLAISYQVFNRSGTYYGEAEHPMKVEVPVSTGEDGTPQRLTASVYSSAIHESIKSRKVNYRNMLLLFQCDGLMLPLILYADDKGNLGNIPEFTPRK